jgi:hypothetical protein
MVFAGCRIFFHEIWSSELGEHFQLFRNFFTVPDSVRYQRWCHLLALVHVNCLETTLKSFLVSIRTQKCILCGIKCQFALRMNKEYALHPLGNPILTHFTKFPIDVSPTGYETHAQIGRQYLEAR